MSHPFQRSTSQVEHAEPAPASGARFRAATEWLLRVMEPKAGPPALRRRGRLLATLLLGSAAMAFLVLPHEAYGWATNPSWPGSRLAVVAAISLAGFAGLLLLNRAGHTRLAAPTYLVMLTVFIALSDSPWEMVEGRSTFFLVIPVVIASVLVSPAASFAMVGVIAAGFAVVCIGPYAYPTIPIAGMCLLALVSWLSARSLEQALARIAEANQELEGRVRERTAELGATRERLVQTEKIRVATSLLGHVAHEINNALAVLRCNLDVLGSDAHVVERALHRVKEAEQSGGLAPTASDASLSEDIEPLLREHAAAFADLNDGVERLAVLVENFRALSRPFAGEEQAEIDLESLVRECVRSQNRDGARLPREVILDLRGAPAVRAAPSDLRAATLAVLGFLRSRPVPRADHGLAIRVRYEVDDGRLVLAISDPSNKLSEEERLRVFDPRLIVDEREGRTMRLDLGMASAYLFLQRNEGRLTVTSSDEAPVTFRVELPLAAENSG